MVSMKPLSAASGVRSSWLALATKSARISSTRRKGVRSWKVMSTSGDGDAEAMPSSSIGVMIASYHVPPHALEELDPLRRGAGRRASDRLENFRNPQRQRHRLAPAQRRRDRVHARGALTRAPRARRRPP